MAQTAKSQGLAIVNAQTAFVTGVQTLDNVVSILIEADVNDSTSEFEIKKIVKKLTSPIRQSHEYLTRALEMWLQENAKLSEKIEKNEDMIGKTKKSLSEKRREIEELNQNLKSLSDQIANKEQELGTARSSLDRANEALRDSQKKLRHKENDQKIVAGVGAAVSFIPVVGWIAGPAMIAVSLTALQDAVKGAEKNVDSTRGNVKECENQISTTKEKQNNLHQQLSQKEKEREEAERELKKLEAEKETLQEEQRRCLEVVEKLKNTCHFMTKIWGKSNVLKAETQDHAYALEPLFTPLKEIAEMFTFEEQNKLKMTTLLSKDIDFTSMSLKMKAICEKAEEKSLEILDNYI